VERESTSHGAGRGSAPSSTLKLVADGPEGAIRADKAKVGPVARVCKVGGMPASCQVYSEGNANDGEEKSGCDTKAISLLCTWASERARHVSRERGRVFGLTRPEQTRDQGRVCVQASGELPSRGFKENRDTHRSALVTLELRRRYGARDADASDIVLSDVDGDD
jgi:hypothetical protein